MSNPVEKKALRRRLLEARQALAEAERNEWDARILANLMSLPEVQAARTLLVYLDFKAEVSSRGLIEWAIGEGKTVCAPVTLVEERRLIPVRLRSADDVVSGAYGIREPKLKERLRLEEESAGFDEAMLAENPAVVPLAEIDVVILPGVGFDRFGGRLGYGGGYYDRFLPRLRPDAGKIAVAYEMQMLPEVPLEPHDTRLDVVVTEMAVYREIGTNAKKS
jgi:5-formyltetrahydrofolate cyclo-ligase